MGSIKHTSTEIMSPEAISADLISSETKPMKVISPTKTLGGISSTTSLNVQDEIKQDILIRKQAKIMFFFVVLWSPNFTATGLFLSYIYYYGIENATGKALTVTSMIFPILGRHLIILLNFKKLKLKIPKAMSKWLNRLIPIIVFSVVGINDAFPTKNSRFSILFSTRCIQIILQMIVVCLFTENWGDIPVAFLSIATLALLFEICLMLIYLYNENSDDKHEPINDSNEFDFDEIYEKIDLNLFNRMEYFIEGVSKTFLNWLDIGTDLLYIITSKFYSPILLILSIVFLFTGPLFQAIFNLLKVKMPSTSAFIKVYVSSFLGLHELEIGFQLMIDKQKKETLKEYYENCARIHVLSESVPQLTLNITNSVLLRMYTPVNILSAVVSFLVVMKTIISMIIQLCRESSIKTQKTQVAEIKINFCEHFLGNVIAIFWTVNLGYLNYCNDSYLWIGISFSCLAYLFSLICIILTFRSQYTKCSHLMDFFSITFTPLFYMPSSIFKKNRCFMIVCYVLFKFGPMYYFIISNATCLSHINPLSTVILVLLVLELFYKSTYLKSFPKATGERNQNEKTEKAIN